MDLCIQLIGTLLDGVLSSFASTRKCPLLLSLSHSS